MENEKVLICYYPTNIMFVDDNQRFLKSVKFKISEDQPYVLYDNPEKALSYLESEYKTNPNIGTFADSDSYDISQTHSTFNFDIGQILNQIANPKRFNELSVLITDYSMPTMDGITFCKKIKNLNLPIKIILVTGEADEALAVAAFNEGYIHKFILKSDPNFDATLNRYIQELRKEYFYGLSINPLNILRHNQSFCFNNPSLTGVFNKILKENKIVEYYLLDTAGSFLLLDEKATPYWFIVQNEEDRRMYFDFASDNNAPENVIDDLEKGKKLIYLSDIDDRDHLQGEKWESVSYPAIKLDDSICYALAKHVADTKLDISKLFSFADYLEKK